MFNGSIVGVVFCCEAILSQVGSGFRGSEAYASNYANGILKRQTSPTLNGFARGCSSGGWMVN